MGRVWLEQGVGKIWKRCGWVFADKSRRTYPSIKWGTSNNGRFLQIVSAHSWVMLILGNQDCFPENDFWLVTNFPRYGLIQQSDHLRKLSSSAAAERMKTSFPIQALFSLIWSETCRSYCTLVGFLPIGKGYYSAVCEAIKACVGDATRKMKLWVM